MTGEMVKLRALVEKTPYADILRQMIGFAADRLIEMKVASLTGAGHGEKSAERLVRRNGYRERDWETRADTCPPLGLVNCTGVYTCIELLALCYPVSLSLPHT
jgi:hypothetical protein